jgi:hypothetical protein
MRDGRARETLKRSHFTTDAVMKLRLALLLPKHPGFQLFLSGFVSEPDSVECLFEIQAFYNG